MTKDPCELAELEALRELAALVRYVSITTREENYACESADSEAIEAIRELTHVLRSIDRRLALMAHQYACESRQLTRLSWTTIKMSPVPYPSYPPERHE